MNRRSFLGGSLAASAGVLFSGMGPRLSRTPSLVRSAHAAPGDHVPYPTLCIFLAGGIDPAMHLGATPNGPYGAGRTRIANRMSGTTGLRTTPAGVRYFVETVTPEGATDFEPHLTDVALLRAFHATAIHTEVCAFWHGEGTWTDVNTFRRDGWANHLASQFRRRGAFVPKPVAVAHKDWDFVTEPATNFTAWGNRSPDPTCAGERILTLDGYFESVSTEGLPPFEKQAPAYTLAQRLDATTYAPDRQRKITEGFASSNGSADALFKSVYGGPAWPPPPNVREALGMVDGDISFPRYPFNPLRSMLAAAYQALAKNLAHVIAFENDGPAGQETSWDTHDDNYAGQIRAGQAFWPTLGKFIALLKATPSPIVAGRSLFDTTNIWIQSEMGRTAGADVQPDCSTNTPTGTGHWYDAPATFLGGRFKRGVAIGGFGDDWTSAPVNPQTGNAAGGSVMQISNVIATVMKAAGGDAAAWTKAAPIDALLDMSR